MAMEIVAAESISQAVEMLTRKPRKAIRDFCVVLPEKLDDFLYDFRESFQNYQTFYLFDPYGEVFLPAEAVSQIKVFSDSVVKWAEENSPAENKVIETYGISLKKIRQFGTGLGHVCEIARENGYSLVGVGD
ncbi:MAG TPA: hypothetical protein IAB74_03045 [Candidatus Faecousia excrementigallinarum]|uniref:Uncharacterized protein n=1 Tax=Candidatus Faecousia excrementigallinarum TaxID=2840806 RepID=A0A9D0Z3W3_9FIRM|nr:hypothetical protein [Candidatus Faecousia excrementigallinarum]